MTVSGILILFACIALIAAAACAYWIQVDAYAPLNAFRGMVVGFAAGFAALAVALVLPEVLS